MSEAAADSLLALIHEELKRQIAETLTAEWKADVLEIAKREDREYTVLTAFRNTLADALEPLRQFPAKYRRMQGKSAEPLPSSIARYRAEVQQSAEPPMTVPKHDAIVAKQIAEDPVFARMMAEPKVTPKEGERDA